MRGMWVEPQDYWGDAPEPERSSRCGRDALCFGCIFDVQIDVWVPKNDFKIDAFFLSKIKAPKLSVDVVMSSFEKKFLVMD